jgi:hypothetical protein
MLTAASEVAAVANILTMTCKLRSFSRSVRPLRMVCQHSQQASRSQSTSLALQRHSCSRGIDQVVPEAKHKAVSCIRSTVARTEQSGHGRVAAHCQRCLSPLEAPGFQPRTADQHCIRPELIAFDAQVQ